MASPSTGNTAPWQLADLDGRATLVVADGVYDLERHSGGSLPADVMAALSRFEELGAVAAGLDLAAPDGPLDLTRLGPPVPRPAKVFGIGLNYRSHAIETGMAIPETPLVFTKFPSCLVGPTADVVLSGDKVDWEVELVAVIGRGGRDIAAADAWSHVAGLTVGQDISDRVVQMAVKPPQFSMGKSFDTYGPIGPTVVSVDSFADPDDLAISCTVGGDPVQGSRTGDLIFGIPALVEYLSSICTLEPGDIIFTGTPAGVGMGMGRFLVHGELIESTIEGIGTLANRCRKP
jgi:2,4-diketo-3-deoxy-L-fuconate hydrolase